MRFRLVCRVPALALLALGFAPVGTAVGAAAEARRPPPHRRRRLRRARCPDLLAPQGRQGRAVLYGPVVGELQGEQILRNAAPVFPGYHCPRWRGQTVGPADQALGGGRLPPAPRPAEGYGDPAQWAFWRGEGRIEISAINRHIGVLVPPDELTPGIKLDQGSDSFGLFYAFRAQTRNSRLNVDLKIYPIDCFL